MKKSFILRTVLMSLFLLTNFISAQSVISDVQCSNNGTFNTAADDFVAFKLNPQPPGGIVVHPFKYNISATYLGNPVTITDMAGVAVTQGNYGEKPYYRINNGTIAAAGNIVITLTAQFGAMTQEVVNLTNPGTCSTVCTGASTGNKVTYYYENVLLLDQSPQNATLPKFDEGTSRTLTGVKIDYGFTASGSVYGENREPNPQTLRIKTEIEPYQFDINTVAHPIASKIIVQTPGYPKSIPVVGAVLVPASGAWPGDDPGVAPNFIASTLTAMGDYANTWLKSALASGIDPTTNPLWVTQLTGNAGDDDDITVVGNPTFAFNAPSINLTAPLDLNAYKGASTFPIAVEATGSITASGSGGLFLMGQATKARYFVKVEYTYDCISQIVANDDAYGPVPGSTTTTTVGNVYANDTLNNNSATPSNVTLTSTPTAQLSINPTTGEVTIAANTPPGTYTINYTICENANLSNCDTATVTVTVLTRCDTVDTFATDQTAFTNTLASDYSSITGATILGGERDIAIINKIGSLPYSFGGSVAFNLLDVTQGSGEKSLIIVQWDGVDNDAATLNPTGLGGINLGGITKITIPVVNKDAAPSGTSLPVTLELWSNAGNASSLTITAPSNVINVNMDFILSSFTPLVGAGVDLTNIGAIVLKLDSTPATTASGLDFGIGSIAYYGNCLTPSPSIAITKDGVYTDANADGITSVGDTINYTFVVTNTGNVPLTNVTVTDNNATVLGGPIAMLAVGASNSTTFTGVHTITAADIAAGYVYNLATATGTPPTGPNVTGTSTDPTPCATCPVNPACTTCTITGMPNTTFAIDDINNTFINTPVSGNVITNDFDLEGHTQTVTPSNTTTAEGTLVLNADGTYTFTPATGFEGTFVHSYTVCDNGIPQSCDTATVTVMVTSNIIELSNITCNPNGTLEDGSDDYITFSMLAPAPVLFYEAPYTYSVTATQNGNPVTVTLSDGSPATNVGYNSLAESFRLANGSSNNGDVTVTVTPNWGGYAPNSKVLVNPGSCTLVACSGGTNKTVTYTYQSPILSTALNNQIFIPKFNQTGGKVLTGVAINYTSNVRNFLIIEGTGNSGNEFSGTIKFRPLFKYNGVNVSTPTDYLLWQSPSYDGGNTYDILGTGNAITVPAQGAWTGDVSSPLSTLTAMPWTSNSVYAGIDPRTDPRWVTNITGNSTFDDDFYFSPFYNTYNYNGSVNYTSATDLASFTGASGNVPFTYSQSIPAIISIGGAGKSIMSTQVYFTTTVTYTYTETCIDAVLDINQTPINVPVSGNVITNDEFTGTATVTSAQFYNASGVLTNLPIGTATPVFTPAGVPAGTMLLNANGTYTYTPATGFVGEIPVNYTLTNNLGSTDSTTLTIKVIPNTVVGNDNPIAQHDTSFTEEGVSVSSTVLNNDSDPDGDALTVTSATGLTIGTATVVSGVNAAGTPVANAGTVQLNANGTYTYVPAAGFVGTVNPLPYVISDGNGGTATANIYITVVGAGSTTNNTFANDDANSAPKGVTMTGNVKTNDTDPEGHTTTVTAATVFSVNGVANGTALTIGTATVIPGVGSVTLNANGTYSFVPVATYVGTVVIPYTICDNGVPQACDQATLELTSLDVVDSIDAVLDINQTPINVPVSGNVITNDEFTGTATVTSAQFYNASGVLTNLPIGTATPVFTPAGVPAGTMLLNANGTYTYTPATGFVGEIPVNYTLTNNLGSTDSTTLTIKVIPNTVVGNDNPIAQHDTSFTEEGVSVSSTVLNNDSDPDGDALTVTSATGLTIGTATVVSGVNAAGTPVANAGTVQLNANGTYTYVPAAGFVGTVNPLPYVISDGNGGTSTADINITVYPNVAGVNNTYANDDANTAPKGSSMTGNVKTNDTDPEGNTSAVTAASASFGGTTTAITIGSATNIPGVGALTLNSDGTYSFVPNATFVGTVVVPYTICDNGTPQACDQATLYLTSLDALAGYCYKLPVTSVTAVPSNHGITALGRAGADNSNWPMVRQSAWTVLEAKTKGFVVNRLTDAQVSAIPSADLREGMMVYNITQDCLQINIDGTATGWRCFNTQTCPD